MAFDFIINYVSIFHFILCNLFDIRVISASNIKRYWYCCSMNLKNIISQNILSIHCKTWLLYKIQGQLFTQGRDTCSRLFVATYSYVLHLPLMSIQLFVPTLKTSRVRVLSTTILSLHHTQHYSIRKSISSIWDNSTCITWITSKCISIFFMLRINDWKYLPVNDFSSIL